MNRKYIISCYDYDDNFLDEYIGNVNQVEAIKATTIFNKDFNRWEDNNFYYVFEVIKNEKL